MYTKNKSQRKLIIEMDLILRATIRKAPVTPCWRCKSSNAGNSERPHSPHLLHRELPQSTWQLCTQSNPEVRAIHRVHAR